MSPPINKVFGVKDIMEFKSCVLNRKGSISRFCLGFLPNRTRSSGHLGPFKIGIIIVGNEILQGFTQDTNSGFLARRLTQLGHDVKKISTVPDDGHAISRDMRTMLHEGIDIVFVCGGLGSTPDDVTIEAISSTLGRPLTVSRKALSWIRKKIKYLHSKGRIKAREPTEPHKRMARVPKGAHVLYNEPGAAPGIVVTIPDRPGRRRTGQRYQKVIILPGVPRELKYIYQEQIEGKVIRPTKHCPFFKELEVTTYESSMDPMLKRLFKEHPEVSIGSYPQDDKKVLIRVSGKKDEVLAIIGRIRDEISQIEQGK